MSDAPFWSYKQKTEKRAKKLLFFCSKNLCSPPWMVQTEFTLISDQIKTVLKRFPAYWEWIPQNLFFGYNLTGLFHLWLKYIPCLFYPWWSCYPAVCLRTSQTPPPAGTTPRDVGASRCLGSMAQKNPHLKKENQLHAISDAQYQKTSWKAYKIWNVILFLYFICLIQHMKSWISFIVVQIKTILYFCYLDIFYTFNRSMFREKLLVSVV